MEAFVLVTKRGELHLVVVGKRNNNFPRFPIFRQKLIDKIKENRLVFIQEKIGPEAESKG